MEEPTMDRQAQTDDTPWDHIRRHWGHARDAMQRQWPLLTRDDIDVVAGSRTYLIEVLQERYALDREHAERQIDACVPTLRSALPLPNRS
jgi:hypothetical protein